MILSLYNLYISFEAERSSYDRNLSATARIGARSLASLAYSETARCSSANASSWKESCWSRWNCQRIQFAVYMDRVLRVCGLYRRCRLSMIPCDSHYPGRNIHPNSGSPRDTLAACTWPARCNKRRTVRAQPCSFGVLQERTKPENSCLPKYVSLVASRMEI
jgi:hypothetical protein